MIPFLIQYRYIAIAAGVAASLLGLYLWGVSRYYDGYEACEASVQSASFAAQENSKKGSDNVRKKEQNLRSAELDIGLCQLNIVRENSGC
jgi:hypothetical protein